MDPAGILHPTILVVDDDEDLLVLMQHSLVREGYDPIFSPNAKNIMEIITHRHPDLVLLDINMQGINGADICKMIKANTATASIPIVMFSANEQIQQVMIDCGADAYLCKPFEPGKLRDVLANLIA